jgi:hypothetical protein
MASISDAVTAWRVGYYSGYDYFMTTFAPADLLAELCDPIAEGPFCRIEQFESLSLLPHFTAGFEDGMAFGLYDCKVLDSEPEKTPPF